MSLSMEEEDVFTLPFESSLTAYDDFQVQDAYFHSAHVKPSAEVTQRALSLPPLPLAEQAEQPKKQRQTSHLQRLHVWEQLNPLDLDTDDIHFAVPSFGPASMRPKSQHGAPHHFQKQTTSLLASAVPATLIHTLLQSELDLTGAPTISMMMPGRLEDMDTKTDKGRKRKPKKTSTFQETTPLSMQAISAAAALGEEATHTHHGLLLPKMGLLQNAGWPERSPSGELLSFGDAPHSAPPTVDHWEAKIEQQFLAREQRLEEERQLNQQLQPEDGQPNIELTEQGTPRKMTKKAIAAAAAKARKAEKKLREQEKLAALAAAQSQLYQKNTADQHVPIHQLPLPASPQLNAASTEANAPQLQILPPAILAQLAAQRAEVFGHHHPTPPAPIVNEMWHASPSATKKGDAAIARRTPAIGKKTMSKKKNKAAIVISTSQQERRQQQAAYFATGQVMGTPEPFTPYAWPAHAPKPGDAQPLPMGVPAGAAHGGAFDPSTAAAMAMAMAFASFAPPMPQTEAAEANKKEVDAPNRAVPLSPQQGPQQGNPLFMPNLFMNPFFAAAAAASGGDPMMLQFLMSNAMSSMSGVVPGTLPLPPQAPLAEQPLLSNASISSVLSGSPGSASAPVLMHHSEASGAMPPFFPMVKKADEVEGALMTPSSPFTPGAPSAPVASLDFLPVSTNMEPLFAVPRTVNGPK